MSEMFCESMLAAVGTLSPDTILEQHTLLSSLSASGWVCTCEGVDCVWWKGEGGWGQYRLSPVLVEASTVGVAFRDCTAGDCD